jgi:hypothetical protein
MSNMHFLLHRRNQMSAVAGEGCGIRLRHSLAFGPVLWRRCRINQESADRVARDLGLEVGQVRGSVRLLKTVSRLPSPERLALVVMRDPGLDDSDIAEMFGRSERWALLVRAQADAIRLEEPLPEKAEWIDDGMQPDYPTPGEILDMVSDLHASGKFRGTGTPWSVPSLQWRHNAFVRVSTE